MAAIPAMTLTQEGKKLYSRVHSGEKIEFTAVKVGNGYIGDEETADDITSLKNEVSATVDIINLNPADTGTICLVTRINSSDTDFYLREIGVFAKIEPDKEVLYGYCNYGDNADYINTFSGSFPVTQEINIYIAVGETKNINVNISDTTVVTPYDLQGIKNDISKLNESKLSYKFVESLPTKPMIYNFENATSLFSKPKQGKEDRGSEEIVSDEESNSKVQKINFDASRSATGSSYSSMKFGTIADDMTSIKIEFDYKCGTGSRVRIELCDVETMDALAESSNTLLRDTARPERKEGVAVEIFNNKDARIQINSAGTALYPNLMDVWLHAEIDIDFVKKNAKYHIYSKNNPSDSISGTAGLIDETATKITGIALYTWVKETVYIDNIRVVPTSVTQENTRYIVPYSGGYTEYMYVGGVPYAVGDSKISKISEILSESHSHGNKAYLDNITSYSETPMRVGRWIDGRYIWRCAINHTLTEEEIQHERVSLSEITDCGTHKDGTQIINECVFIQNSTDDGNLADSEKMQFSSGGYDLTNYSDMIDHGGCDAIVGYIEYAK